MDSGVGDAADINLSRVEITALLALDCQILVTG